MFLLVVIKSVFCIGRERATAMYSIAVSMRFMLDRSSESARFEKSETTVIAACEITSLGYDVSE